MNKLPTQVAVSTDWPTGRTQLQRVLELHARGVNLINIGWEELPVVLQTGSSSAPPSYDTSTHPGTLLFPTASTKSLAGVINLPHSWGEGTMIIPHIHWSKTTADAGGLDVGWQFRAFGVNVGSVIGSAPGWDDHTLQFGDLTTQEIHNVSSFPEVILTSNVLSTLIFWELRRDVSVDTYASDARLLSLTLFYQLDTNGSRDMYTK